MYGSMLDVGLGQKLQLRIRHTSNKMRSPWSKLTSIASVSPEYTLMKNKLILTDVKPIQLTDF